MSGFTTNGMTVATPPLTGIEQAAFDTQLPQGETPETEAISIAQIRGFYRPPVTLTSGTIVNTNALSGDLFLLTLTTNATLANPTNLQAGQGWKVEVDQDTVGARTLAYGSLYIFSGSSTLTTTASAIDLLSFTYDGTNILSTLATKF
jgi:hypothetical protein